MSVAKLLGLIVLLGAVVAAPMSIFTVKEYELAIKFRLGKIVRTDFSPGLYFQVPIVNNVRKFEKRILTLDTEPERFLTGEKKNVIVDFFVKWRIGDIADYYRAFAGDERQAALRLHEIINNGLQLEFDKRTIADVVSGDRAEIMDNLATRARVQVEKFGIEIVDVRIKQVELPSGVTETVYKRMRAERQRIAKDHRSKGHETAERIRADADRQRTVLMAEAYRDSEKMRGEGDAKATEIYANAYTKDEEFYSFTRSLNAYKSSFGNKGDIIILEPDSDFFKYFKAPKK